MKISQLVEPVKSEVKQPFERKLARARQLIRMYCSLCPRGAAVSCSFGKDSLAVLFLVREVMPNVPVVFNNTLCQYHETYELRDRLKEEWHLNLIETKPVDGWTFFKIAEKYGLDDGQKYRDACCDKLKDKPMRQIIRQYGFKYNFTGITAIESRVRMWRICQGGTHYYSKKDGVLRIHPIAYWTPEEVWSFIDQVQIPVNQAYEKYGVDRVGCVPCTSHKGWREQLARVNPRMYKLVQERFFGQKILAGDLNPSIGSVNRS